MTVEDIALICVAVALWGVWMLAGAWWPLGLVLALVEQQSAAWQARSSS